MPQDNQVAKIREISLHPAEVENLAFCLNNDTVFLFCFWDLSGKAKDNFYLYTCRACCFSGTVTISGRNARPSVWNKLYDLNTL